LKNNANSHPFYKGRSIPDVAALSQLLGIDESDLLAVAQGADSLYVPGKRIKKSDGTFRQTLKPLPQLSLIQRRIKDRIFANVIYPEYLMGGIADHRHPRSPHRNASRHANKRVLIKTDIKSFFPSIRPELVAKMWKGLFQFGDAAVDVLTKLTTKAGSVPQGGRTSTHVSNLILWDVEPRLYRRFQRQGFEYTRFIDDINVSSVSRLTKAEMAGTLAAIIAMLGSRGFRPNRRKQAVETSGHAMTIHNLKTNQHASLGRDRKQRLRVEVHRLVVEARTGVLGDDFMKRLQSVRVKVGQAQRLNPSFALKLKRDLLEVRPSRV
jgi:hypothetical protein